MTKNGNIDDPPTHFPMSGSEFLERLKMFGLREYGASAKHYPTHTSTYSIWLRLGNEEVLRFSSEMHDLQGWDEVGSLVIEFVDSSEILPPMVALPAEWGNISAVEKLVIKEENYCEAESGIKINASDGQAMFICSAAAPFEVSVQAPFWSGDFKPEYDLDSYELVGFS